MWLLWFGTAIIFFIIEMLNMTFYVICLGIGALAASVVALVIPDKDFIWLQLASFVAATFVAFIVVQPLSKRLKREDTRYKTNFEAIYDEIGIVIKEIGPDGKEGRVKIRGSTWRAGATNDQHINVQERVKILKIDGTKLYVRPFSEN